MISINKLTALYTAVAEPFVKFLCGQGIGPAGSGIGGTIVQATSKATGVALPKVTGQITMNNANLASLAIVSFALTNALIEAGDYVHVQHISAGTVGSYLVQAQSAAGSANVTVTNITGGGLAEAIVLQFYVYKLCTT
jgi:hypothetical protein